MPPKRKAANNVIEEKSPRRSSIFNDADVDMLAQGYLREAVGNTGELLRRLSKLHELLSIAEQEEEHGHLHDVASELVHRSVMGHKDGKVVSYACCCLADVLRLCVPDIPYDEKTLVAMFEMFIAQLKGLNTETNSEGYQRTFYLLECLARVKAFVLLVQFEGGVGDELISSLLYTLFDSLPETNVKVRSFVVSIVQSIIEELDGAIPQTLLDRLFTCILQPVSRDRPAAAEAAREVIASTAAKLEPSVSDFLNGYLLTGQTRESDLVDSVPEIILELFRFVPAILLQVIPNLGAEVRSPDTKTRLASVELLSNLVVARGPFLASEYRDVASALLSRLNDVDASVRLLLLERIGDIVRADASFVPEVQRMLLQRIVDGEERVRYASIKVICNAVGDDSLSGLATKDLLEAVTGRLRDKKLQIRQIALHSLVNVFRFAQDRNGYDIDRWASAEDREKFYVIPQNILCNWPLNVPEPDARARLWVEFRRCLTSSADGADVAEDEDGNNNQNTSTSSSGTGRRSSASNGASSSSSSVDHATEARAVLSIYGSLSTQARDVFIKIVEYAGKMRSATARYIEALTTPFGSSGVRESLEHATQNLANHLVNPPRSKSFIADMTQSKVSTKALTELMSATTEWKARTKHHDELVRRFAVGSHAHVARYAFAAINGHPFDKDFVGYALREALNKQNTENVLLLLRSVAKTAPGAFTGHWSRMLDFLASSSLEATLTGALRIVELLGNSAQGSDISAVGEMNRRLIALCSEESFSPRVAKRSVRALSALVGEKGMQTPLTTLMRTFVSNIVGSRNTAAVLGSYFSGLNAMVTVRPRLFDLVSEEDRQNLIVEITKAVQERIGGAAGGAANGRNREAWRVSALGEARAQGIKLLASILKWRVTGEGVDTSELLRIDQLTAPIVGLLTTIIQGCEGAQAATADNKRNVLVAASTMLKLVALPGWDDFVGPREYAALVALTLHEDHGIRRTFCEKMFKTPAPSRAKFLPLLALLACDDIKDLSSYAKAALATAVKACRANAEKATQGAISANPKAAAAAAAAASSTGAHRESGEGLAAADGSMDPVDVITLQSYKYIPENALPYLIHTLANHEIFKRSDAPVYKFVSRVINVFLDAVLSASDSYAFLQQIALTVRGTRDRTTNRSDDLVIVSDIVLFFIKRKSESRSWKLQPFPGRILLPRELFTMGHLKVQDIPSTLTSQFIREHGRRDNVDKIIDQTGVQSAPIGGGFGGGGAGSPTKRPSEGGSPYVRRSTEAAGRASAGTGTAIAAAASSVLTAASSPVKRKSNEQPAEIGSENSKRRRALERRDENVQLEKQQKAAVEKKLEDQRGSRAQRAMRRENTTA